MNKKLVLYTTSLLVITAVTPCAYSMDDVKQIGQSLWQKTQQTVTQIGHTIAAGYKEITLNEQENEQLYQFNSVLVPHAYVAHKLEKNLQTTVEYMRTSPAVIALAPASLVAMKLFSKVGSSNIAAASLLACTSGAITWFASRKWMKNAPHQAAYVNPFVFAPRLVLWGYEKILKFQLRRENISKNVLSAISHDYQGLNPVSIPQYNIFLRQTGTEDISIPSHTKNFAASLARMRSDN